MTSTVSYGSWRSGAFPADTVGYGGLVPNGFTGTGFFFAKFNGDHAIAVCNDGRKFRVESSGVKWWNCSLTLPPDQTQVYGKDHVDLPVDPSEGLVTERAQ